MQRWDEPCALCDAADSYLDEVITDDEGARMFVCSDTDHCAHRRAAGQHGRMLGSEAGRKLAAGGSDAAKGEQ